jgi:hypothetical protein
MVPGHPADFRHIDQVPQQLEDGADTGNPEKQGEPRAIELKDPVQDLSQPQWA